jgi:PadR family transcriptional regulator, regulatory protein AphA
MSDELKLTTLGGAILSLLMRCPMSGYDISLQLRSPVSYYWQAKHSQIYPELSRLSEEGYVTYTVVGQQDRPDKKVYSVTEEGREAFTRWWASPVKTSPSRDELVLRAFSLWQADSGVALRLFREEEARHLRQLEEYEAIRARMEAEASGKLNDLTSKDFSDYVTLMRGIGYEEEYGRWCRWVIEQIEQLGTGRDAQESE